MVPWPPVSGNCDPQPEMARLHHLRDTVAVVDGAVLPLWLSAIAAILTLVFAATLAALALRGQRALVRRLDLVEDLTRREAEQRVRSQAQRVTGLGGQRT
jgi:hypothetical protein